MLLEGEVVVGELPARLPFVADLDVADHRAVLTAAGRGVQGEVAERVGQVDVQGAGVPLGAGYSRITTRSPASQPVPFPRQ
jgi:hypothetical protein